MATLHTFLLFFFIKFITALEPTNDQQECVVTNFIQVLNATQSCKNIILDNIKVPGGQTLSLPLKPGTTLTFRGYIYFGYFQWNGPLVNISGSDFIIKGEEGSVLNGQGPAWWDGKGGWSNITKPKFVQIISAKNATFENIHLLDCPLSCVDIIDSSNLVIKHWKVDVLKGDQGVAPPNKSAHNSDGFGIGGSSRNILIEDSVVYNQDDCVAIRGGINITVRRMFCHGSHGLSISALTDDLSDLLFEDSIVTMGINGIHIKTHIDVGEGLINNVTYRNITILDSKSCGINIQQNYQNVPHSQDMPPKNNIPIRNLKMINIFGNVLHGAVPVYVLCAEKGCFDWQWEGINIYGGLANNCTNYVPEGYKC